MKAVVHFRTLPNGNYKYMSGKRRGWWRVLIVHDEKGCLTLGTRNVKEVIYNGHQGLQGVGEKSQYNIEHSHAKAQEIAARWNAEHGV